MTLRSAQYHKSFNRELQVNAQRREQQKEKPMAFDLNNYETVEDRLVRFWAEHGPGARVETTMMSYDGDSCVFRAEIYFKNSETVPTATGYAQEIRSDRGVNSTSFVENCETSAIGRALANCGYATHGKRPSREEMSKVSQAENHSAGHASPSSPGASEHTPRGSFATPKQLGYIKKLARDKGMDDLALLEMIQLNLNDDSAVLELLKSHEASQIIERLK